MDTIEILDGCRTCSFCDDVSGERCFECEKVTSCSAKELNATYDLAIQALKKQLPKKVIVLADSSVCCSACGGFLECAEISSNKKITFIGDMSEYCRCCGQKQNWTLE